MIRTWPGQTKEEWTIEYYRDKALTEEEKDREMDEYLKSIDDKWKKVHEKNECKIQQKQSASEIFARYDHPNSLENDEATILWIIVMVIG